MMRQKLSIGVVAAAFTLSVAPAWAQDDRGRPQGEQGRPSSGESTGSAVPRGGGSDSGSSSASSSGSESNSSSSSSGSSSSGSSGSSSAWMGSSPTNERAPARPEGVDRGERAEQRRGGGSSSGTAGRAVPRGESGARTGGSVDSTTSTTSAGSDSQPSQGRSRAVPTYSRPRDGRTSVGTAVDRNGPTADGNYRGGYYYDPYYSFYYNPNYSNRYSYWSPFGYGYGLGYFSYDPFLFSGYGYSGYYGGSGAYDPYYGGGGGSGSYSSRSGQGYGPAGALRLKVKPANAQVYIDGYYVGVIDSFDGALQRLSVESGAHRVELRSEGYEPVQFDVMITPGETITYKGEMKRQ